MDHEVRYAAGGDVSIAYQVLGRAGPDLVFVPGFVSHLDLAWEERFFARFLRSLGSFTRLIWFDKRGTGLSDVPREEVSMDACVEDVRVVMDAAGSRRATLFGVAVGAGICTSFALKYPGRTRSMILWDAHARLLEDDGYAAGWSEEFFWPRQSPTTATGWTRSTRSVPRRGTGCCTPSTGPRTGTCRSWWRCSGPE
ncbi:alpha/beta hydrolase [Rhodococcus ruber]|uniref:Adenylate/guanylate cyclase n=1 Tax=Rhodococcus ruber TaxID=1830 RepID=A0A098BK37_9NOCA|nr:alpha/beta hydrolase [Rhodococcus ruber]MCD2126207.1 alpha/beta hydrolase [Rhodococcus ruber]MCZ4502536.1 alpha/beta hydrolase [Rhodococcus ruber]MCZ4529875.1 alpha/beta hydrolase [Rhodococcus ruber]MCZ4620089.1 alpha/beta hydrolase [Rhodococcus ruber]MDI9967328.1 alpha/beta hydrolase [Rhodococcus ruber]